jgi:hypothetical protein
MPSEASAQVLAYSRSLVRILAYHYCRILAGNVFGYWRASSFKAGFTWAVVERLSTAMLTVAGFGHACSPCLFHNVRDDELLVILGQSL